MTAALRGHPSRVVVMILAAALLYWLWFGMTQRSMIADDGISFLAAQSILDRGVLLLPSGFPYHRGYIPHYMLAGSIFAFGINDFAVMLPSLLMALGSLWLTYLFARDVLGRPWVGVAASALLVLFEIETFYATSPRMYMALQFFAMLAAYSAWRGYIQGRVWFRPITFLALGAAMLSSRMGLGVVLAIPFALAVVALLRRDAWPRPSVLEVAGTLMVTAAVIFAVLYHPPGRIHDSVTLAGSEVDRLGLNLNPTVWGRYFIGSDRALPYKDKALYVGLLFAIGVSLFAARRRLASDHGLAFSLAIMGLYGLLLLFFVKHTAARYWLDVLPIYLIVGSASVANLIALYVPSVRQRGAWRSVVVRSSVAATGIALIGYIALGAPAFDLVKKASGPPCWGQGWRCDKSIEEHYEYVRPSIGPEDLIIASNPWITNYYLGRVNGFLREKRDGEGGYTAFAFPTDDYFAVPLIDTLEELEELQQHDRQVWVITDNVKLGWASSQSTRDYLESEFDQFHLDDLTATYVNCLNPPCNRIVSADGKK